MNSRNLLQSLLIVPLLLWACDSKEEVLLVPDDEVQDVQELSELDEDATEPDESDELELPPDCVPSSHASAFCYEDNLYWYDSCGVREELKESCATGCTIDACNTESPSYHLSINFSDNDSTLPAEQCNPADSRTLYQGRATLSAPNLADYEYFRCDGEAFDISYLWVTAAGTDILLEGDVAVYFARFESDLNHQQVSLEDDGKRLIVRNVPIWPSELDLDNAPCDAFKSMALITDRSEAPGVRHYYQYQSVTFVKVCE
ncbi:MAG: hypothetical protein RBU37_13100 [Myxococcota bacterium]|nr:hypothetical protein [Myxococcota bacterium]